MNGNRSQSASGGGAPGHPRAPKGPAATSGGVDTLLTRHGRALGTGEEARFLLVKGPDGAVRADPVNPAAPRETFPLVGKFSESVVRPDFHRATWRTARLFQQDIPRAEDDSDEEGPAARQNQPRKRWRARNQREAGRQWVLQEQVEFLESMMAKRQQQKQRNAGGGAGGGGTQPRDGSNGSATSSMYVGLPEHNPSQYILLETVGKTDGSNAATAMDGSNDDDDDSASQDDPPTIQVTMLPTPFATISFSQPKASNTLSMSEAEQAIQDQRGKMTRFMMHDQQRIFQGQAPIHRSRTRLLGKLLPEEAADIDPATGKIKRVSTAKRRRDGEDEDDDDIMSDLAFRNRKGNGRARKELLNSFGDAGVKVDADGVLGGTNDAVFGQRGQTFGRFQADKSAAAADGAARGGDGDDGGGGDLRGIGDGGAETTKGNDGLAMADDFYQRDVQAEYEELDYDANEQFDDDDVDVGETEVVVENNTMNEDDDDEDLDDDVEGARVLGAEGLASLAGFKLMLAKAKGEITPEQAAELADKSKRQAEEMDKRQDESDRKKDDGSGDHLAKIMEAAEKARRDAEEKSAAAAAVLGGGGDGGGGDGKARASSSLDNGPEYDENGARIINLQAVRREIWLNHGKIATKRLAKIFNVGKKSPPDRQVKLKEAIRELCTMETDPLGGNVLVLKQHYSNLK
jgi:hypothetical protein